MKMEWSITAGELLQVVSFLIAAFALYNRLTEKIVRVETKVNIIYDWWVKQIKAYKEES